MNESADWMIYGANGYTGRLIAREAARRGMHPVLAGRSAEKLEPLARELDLPSRIFALDSAEQIAPHLEGMRVVAHCAGPFSATAEAMMDACIAAGAHYLDITGEIDVIEAAHARHERAAAAGVMLMPAVGFDVVPSDCLAKALADELPGAVQLQLAFTGMSSLSPGTAKTAVEGMSQGGRVRQNGRIIRVPAYWTTLDVPFRGGARRSVTIPWGDVASAYYTTGIPNIEVYCDATQGPIKWLGRFRFLLPLTGIPAIQRFFKRRIERRVAGPTPEELARSTASLWGRVRDDTGRSVEATLETAGGYPLTVMTTLAVVERVLAGEVAPGFATPAGALGKELILSIPGSDLRIESPVAGRES